MSLNVVSVSYWSSSLCSLVNRFCSSHVCGNPAGVGRHTGFEAAVHYSFRSNTARADDASIICQKYLNQNAVC